MAKKYSDKELYGEPTVKSKLAGPDEPYPIVNPINGLMYNINRSQVQVQVIVNASRRIPFSIPMPGGKDDIKGKILAACAVGLVVIAVPVAMAIYTAATTGRDAFEAAKEAAGENAGEAAKSSTEVMTEQGSTGKGSPPAGNIAANSTPSDSKSEPSDSKSEPSDSKSEPSDSKSEPSDSKGKPGPAAVADNFGPSAAMIDMRAKPPEASSAKSSSKPDPLLSDNAATKPDPLLADNSATEDGSTTEDKPKSKNASDITYGHYKALADYLAVLNTQGKTVAEMFGSPQAYPGKTEQPLTSAGGTSSGTSGGIGSGGTDISSSNAMAATASNSSLQAVMAILSQNQSQRSNPPSASPISP